jgi:hypothetical protein
MTRSSHYYYLGRNVNMLTQVLELCANKNSQQLQNLIYQSLRYHISHKIMNLKVHTQQLNRPYAGISHLLAALTILNHHPLYKVVIELNITHHENTSYL